MSMKTSNQNTKTHKCEFDLIGTVEFHDSFPYVIRLWDDTHHFTQLFAFLIVLLFQAPPITISCSQLTDMHYVTRPPAITGLADVIITEAEKFYQRGSKWNHKRNSGRWRQYPLTELILGSLTQLLLRGDNWVYVKIKSLLKWSTCHKSIF